MESSVEHWKSPCGARVLRAQTLSEPIRSRPLELLVDYTETAVRVATRVTGSAEQLEAAEKEQRLQRRMWALGGEALDQEPLASAPRLYVEALNEMIDAQTVRVAALNNRVPSEILWFELVSASIALGLLAAYLALVGRGLAGVLIAAAVVASLLFLSADLDRPTRGPIQVSDAPLTEQLESMRLPPAAAGPRS